MKTKFFKKIKFFILPIFLFSNLLSVPMNSYYDSAPFYDFKGIDKYYSKKKQPLFSFALSPYYQHSSGCRGLNGNRDLKSTEGLKLGEGDRLGVWNMLGMFFGPDASPSDKTFQFGAGTFDKTNYSYLKYPNLVVAGAVLDGNAETILDNTGANPFTNVENNDSKTPIDPDSSTGLIADFTDEESFNPDEEFGRVTSPIDFEKLGVRGKFNFDFFKWLGMNIKTGVCHYHQDPDFEDLTETYAGHTWSGKPAVENSKKMIKRYLTTTGITEDKMKKILQDDLKINIDYFSKTCLEDTHLETYFNWPIHLQDEDGDHVMSFIPIISVGIWVPTGAKKKEDYAFSLATGNDGYTGLTLQGSLNMDFPGTVQLAFGLGATFFNRRELKKVHIPSSLYQYGIYPWTADIKKRAGVTWYANASFKAENFLDSLSLYFDLIHTQHEKDSITFIENRTDGKKNENLFKKEKYRIESSWRTLNIFSGLDYQIAPSLEVGASFQTVLSGIRIYRTTTIIGTIKLNF